MDAASIIRGVPDGFGYDCSTCRQVCCYDRGVDRWLADEFARADYALTYGKRLSVGAAYTVSRPASEAFPDTGGKVLTDGYVGLASYWGLGGINLTGEKNGKRVGELVVREGKPRDVDQLCEQVRQRENGDDQAEAVREKAQNGRG